MQRDRNPSPTKRIDTEFSAKFQFAPMPVYVKKFFIRKLYHNFFKTAMPFRAHLGMPFRAHLGRKGIIRKKMPIPAKYVFTFRGTCDKMYVVEIGILPTNHRIIL